MDPLNILLWLGVGVVGFYILMWILVLIFGARIFKSRR